MEVTSVHAATVAVNGTDSIYNYGGTSVAGGGSTSPPEISLTAGSNRYLTFPNVTGQVTVSPGSNPFGPHGPDGSPSVFNMNVSPAADLSGLISSNVGFLAGVFLNGLEGSQSTPPTLDLSASGIGENFSSLSPLVDQVFFIGDGLTGTGSGSLQVFNVPNGAATLVLGIVDANGYSGPPGAYFDNSGTFTVELIQAGVPEPSTWAMLVIGFAGLGIAGCRASRKPSAAFRSA